MTAITVAAEAEATTTTGDTAETVMAIATDQDMASKSYRRTPDLAM